MMNCVRFLLCFVISTALTLKPLLSQNEKIIEAFNAMKYEKCIKICEKTINQDKKKRNLSAHFYIALCYAEMSTIKIFKENYNSLIEKSFRTLRTVKKKDIVENFFQKNIIKVANIKRIAFLQGEEYLEEAKFLKAIKLYDLLIEVFNDNTAYYKKGKCQIANGENEAGLANIVVATNNIYSEIKEGDLDSSYLPEAFIDLMWIYYDEGSLKEAFKVSSMSIDIYPDNENVRNNYLQLLKKYKYDEDHYLNLDSFYNLLKVVQNASDIYKDDERFYDLKWEICRYYLDLLIENNNYSPINACLSYVTLKDTSINKAKDHKNVTEMLIKLIFANTYITKDDFADITAVSEILTGSLIKIQLEINDSLNIERYIEEIINSYLNNEEIDYSGILLLNFKKLYPESSNLVILEDKFADLVISEFMASPESTLDNLHNLRNWEKLFPDNKKFKKFQRNSSVQLIERYINSEKFTDAGELIRYARKKFPEDKRILELHRNWVVKDYKLNYERSRVSTKQLKWTGSYENCEAGKISGIANDKFLQRFNYFRRFAGAPDKCILSVELDSFCQKAALIMGANGKLSHKPDKSLKCFTKDGYKGAGNSNLSLGSHCTEALKSQLRDSGINNYFVGHRRWILNPLKKVYGHGSTSGAMALWTLSVKGGYYPDSITDIYTRQFISWPPEGFVPKVLVFPRWSFSLKNADLSQVKVSMSKNGIPIELEVQKYVSGYGLPTIVWEPETMSYTTEEEPTFTIMIENVKNYEGKIKNYKYQVTLITP